MSTFHVVFVGIALAKFSTLMSHVRAVCGYRTSYIVTSIRDVHVLRKAGVASRDIHHLDERQPIGAPTAEDITYLNSLERDDVPTIHNMMMSDNVISNLTYAEGLAYAAHLARGLRRLYTELRPTVVIGGHDRMHSSMGFAVAKAEGIPWFCLNFSVVPIGYVALSPGIVPDQTVCLRGRLDRTPRDEAAMFLDEFEKGRLRAPAYVSAYSLGMVFGRLGPHLREGVRSVAAEYSGRRDKYNDYSFSRKVRQYLRKRRNMLRLPTHWFLKEPPAEPFLFFGLHMQPESTPDVYAPFHANQRDVIEKIARAMPPTHRFLVKLHISDSDNYSRKQLAELLRLPGVRLVLPNVSSRDFIDKCAAVVTISGTMGLEGALLGKPVVVFGKMNYEHFPSVIRVRDMYDLPELLRSQLSRQPPPRDAILDAYAAYLSTYFRATSPGAKIRVDDWTYTDATPDEMNGFVELFRALEGYLSRPAREIPVGAMS